MHDLVGAVAAGDPRVGTALLHSARSRVLSPDRAFAHPTRRVCYARGRSR